MTIVITCLTEDVVYQVSDRRLTNPLPPHAILNDAANKVIFANGHMAYGYTGIAQILGVGTDVWLQDTISKHSQAGFLTVANGICKDATAAFKRMPYNNRVKRHAFQGVGWGQFENDDLEAFALTIHNALNPETLTWKAEADAQFRHEIKRYRLRGHQFVSLFLGAPISDYEKSTINMRLRKSIRRKTDTQWLMLVALIRAVRWLSQSRGHKSIGSTVMALAIPKRAVESLRTSQDILLLVGGPFDDAASFFYSEIGNRTEHHGPLVVSGESKVSGIKVSYANSEPT